MPDNVVFGQKNDGDVLEVVETMDRVDQAALQVAGQIDLRDVAGDDDLRAVAHAREEHLHLSDRRVLPFVENDDGMIQRTATHEGERRDFDDVGVEVALDLFGLHHVVEAVEQRAQIRIDLGRDVAWQEAELFAGFDGGANENDAFDGALAQHVDGHADRQIRLAGAGGADGEDDVVALHRFDVMRLAVGAWTNGTVIRHGRDRCRNRGGGAIVAFLCLSQDRADVFGAQGFLTLQRLA